MENVPKDLILVICGMLDDKSKLDFLSTTTLYDKFKCSIKFNLWAPLVNLRYAPSFSHFKVDYNDENIIPNYCEHLMVVRTAIIRNDIGKVPINFAHLSVIGLKSLTLRVIFKPDTTKCSIDYQYININVPNSILYSLDKYQIKLYIEYVFDDKFDWKLNCVRRVYDLGYMGVLLTMLHNVIYQINTNVKGFQTQYVNTTVIVPGQINWLLRN